MSEIKHTTLKGELLYLIGRASAPLSGAELYERCELADEIAKVAKALANLQSDGKIVRVPGEGRARYKLADGVAAPAPAGKIGRSKAVQADDSHTRPARIVVAPDETKPAPGLPAIDIPAPRESAPPYREKGRIEAALRRAEKGAAERSEPAAAKPTEDDEIARGLDQVEEHVKAARLADAILARVKRQLAPTLCELEAAAGLDRLHVHVHIEQVDIHLGGL